MGEASRSESRESVEYVENVGNVEDVDKKTWDTVLVAVRL